MVYRWTIAISMLSMLVGLSTFGQTAFIQSTNPDALVVIRTVDFHTNTPHGGHVWAEITNALASGGYAMAARPNVGSNYDSGYIGLSPQMDFNVWLNRTGIHYVWIRGYGAGPLDDSLHVGF